MNCFHIEINKPTGHPLVDVDNYNIFYYYDMQNDDVSIIRVLYNKVVLDSLLDVVDYLK